MQYGDIDLIKEYLSKRSSSACYSLVSRNQQSVFGVCYKILRNREEAEEAAQDSFMKCFDSLDKLKELDKFKPWLLSIAYRTAIDHYRRRKPIMTDIDKVQDRVTPDKNDPHSIFQKGQSKQLLENIFASMEPTDSTILTLFYIEDMPVKSIAKVLDQSESNVKIKLMRMRDVLRKKMTPIYLKEFKE